MLDVGLGGDDGDPLDTDDLEKSSGWVWQSSRAILLLSSLLVHLHKKQTIRNLVIFMYQVSYTNNFNKEKIFFSSLKIFFIRNFTENKNKLFNCTDNIP